MANFAVAASAETIEKANQVMDLYAKEGEKKEETLRRIFETAEKEAVRGTHPDLEPVLKAVDQTIGTLIKQINGIVAGQDSNIANLEEKLEAAIESKNKIRDDAEKQEQIAKEKMQEAAQLVAEANKTAAQATKDAEAAKEQAATSAQLVAEKEKTVNSLAEKLADAESKLSGYADLEKSEKEAQEKIKELERALKDLQKDHEVEIRELKTEMERKVSDAEKDAKLAISEAVTTKEREIRDTYEQKLRDADRENAKLQLKIEQMEHGK